MIGVEANYREDFRNAPLFLKVYLQKFPPGGLEEGGIITHLERKGGREGHKISAKRTIVEGTAEG